MSTSSASAEASTWGPGEGGTSRHGGAPASATAAPKQTGKEPPDSERAKTYEPGPKSAAGKGKKKVRKKKKRVDASKSPLWKWRVLVCEDDLTNQKLMVRKLTGMKPFSELLWDVKIAPHGEACVEMVKEAFEKGTPYNLITMDQVLEKTGGIMTGHQTTKVIRETQAEQKGLLAPPALVVGASANCDETNRALFLRSGMNFVWGKPMPLNNVILKDLLRLCANDK